MATDEQIKNSIEDQLEWDSRIGIASVDVDVDNGSVLLSGVVPSHLAHQAASEDAWVIRGVDDVNNNLTISYPATIIVPGDEEITASAEAIFRFNPAIDETRINISVRKGWVH